MPDFEANTPVENVAPDVAPVADAQEDAVEEVVVTAGSNAPTETGEANTVVNNPPPADEAKPQTQKDIDRAFGQRLAQERKKYEQSPEWVLGSMYLDERAKRDGVSRAEAYQRIQQERLDARADAYARNPKQFYADLLSGNVQTPQRPNQYSPEMPPASPEMQAQQVGAELASMYQAGQLPEGFDIRSSLDQDTYNNIVEYGAKAAMRIWAAEHGPAAEIARRQSGPAPMRPTSSNKQSGPTDFSQMSTEDFFKKRAEIQKALLDGKKVRLS
jgi:hypothetical protein